MSKYCGKCDFGDFYEISEERMKNADIYIGNNIVPLRIDSYKDALPYFPFLVSSAISSDSGTVVFLSERSYIDVFEESILENKFDRMKKAYKKAKKKSQNVELKDLINPFTDEIELSYAKILIESNGKCERPKDIHLKSSEYYRNEFYNDMIKAGWDENKAYKWVYGFDAWLEKLRKEKDVK